MKELLSKARARVIRHLVLDKGALALTIGMGGLVLLLLAGTEIFDWYWPVLLAAVSLGVGIYQIRRHVPTRYQLAQRIDYKLALADSLSTAVYFSEHPQPGLEAICTAQYHAADGLAGTVSLERALPVTRSRYLLPAIGLLAVALGLFITRYVMIGSLDLQGSLVEAAVDTFFTSPAEKAVANARPDLRSRPFDPSQPEAPPEEGKGVPPDAEKGKELLTDSQQKQDTSGTDKSDDQEGDQGDSGDLDNNSPQDQKKQGKDNNREGDESSSNDSQEQDQRSMLDKIRDAAQNLMNKLSSNDAKPQNAKSDSQQKGQKSDKAGKDDGDSNQDSQADAQSNSNDQSSKGKADPKQASQSQDQKGGEKGASGSGENEGKKDLEEAKAEEAMGKVSELLTQRSAGISGEMTVEVNTTDQHLKTALTQQKAGHTDSGGEIHRDQIPLSDQMFVERYFQEIRKPGKAPTGDIRGKTK